MEVESSKKESPDVTESLGQFICYFRCFLFLFYLFIRLHQVLVAARGIFVAACGIFSCGMRGLRCGMRDLVPWPGIELGAPALGAWSLNRWTTGEVPRCFLYCNI